MQLLSFSCAALALAAVPCQALIAPRKAFTPAPDSYSVKVAYTSDGKGLNCPDADKITATANSDYTAVTLQFQGLSIAHDHAITCTVMLEFEPKKSDAVGLLYTVLESKYTTTEAAMFGSTYTFAYDVLGELYGYLTSPTPATSFTNTPQGVAEPKGTTVKLSEEFKSPTGGAGSIALEVRTSLRGTQAQTTGNSDATLIREYEQELTLAWAKAPSLL